MAPPPITTREFGSDSASMASRLVQWATGSKGGGTKAWPPVPRTSARRAVNVRPATSTDRGPVTRARPRTKCPPLPSNRSTATVSSHESVASSRIRRATGAQSGVTTDVPALPGMRLPSASSPAARTIILEGMHPQ